MLGLRQNKFTKILITMLAMILCITYTDISGIVVKAEDSFRISQTGYNSVEISWNASSNSNATYTVYRAVVDNTTTVTSDAPKDNEYKALATTKNLTYNDINLDICKTYWYKVEVDGALIGFDHISLNFETLKNIHTTSEGDKVCITWDAVPGATKYIVTREMMKNGNLIMDTAYKAIVDSNIYYTEKQENTLYKYTIRPYASDTAMGENDGKLIKVYPAPANVKVTSKSYNTATIQYDKVSGATNYRIYRSTKVDGTYTLVGTNNASTLSYTDKNLTPGTTYYYKVEAYETGNNLVSAGIMSGAKSVKPVLAAPKNVKASGYTYTSLKITWDTVAGAKSYNVYAATSKSGTYKKIASNVKKTSYTNKNLSLGERYYYKIEAVSGTAVSAKSAAASAKVVTAATKEVNVTSDDYNSITLKWKKVSGATKYYVYRSTKETTGYKRLKTTKGLSYTDKKVDGGVKYYYKVVSVAGSIKGQEKIVTGVAVPKAVTNLKVQSKSSTSVKVSFKAAKGATGYCIYRSTSKNGTYKKIGTTKKVTYTDKTAKTGVKYYYKVAAAINGYEGELSGAKAVTARPNQVKNVSMISAGKSKVKISWDKQSDADSYQIYVSSEAKTGYRLVKTVKTNSATVSLASNSTTYFRIYAVKDDVQSKYIQTSYTSITQITLDATEKSIKCGGTFQLKASILPAGANDPGLSWSTSNKKVATVTNDGIVTGKKNGTCTITATASNGMTATCKVTVSQYVIVIDAGHGGSDSGCTYGSALEKNINLQIATYIKEELETYQNVKVVMTRSTDTFIPLENRSIIAANNSADFFVSVHCNTLANKSSSINGSEVYSSLNPYFANSTARMGSLILAELQAVGMTNRGVRTVKGENGDYYAVIRNTVARNIPAVLVEQGYLPGSHDYGVLTSAEGQKKLGVANATGIAKYFELKKK